MYILSFIVFSLPIHFNFHLLRMNIQPLILETLHDTAIKFMYLRRDWLYKINCILIYLHQLTNTVLCIYGAMYKEQNHLIKVCSGLQSFMFTTMSTGPGLVALESVVDHTSNHYFLIRTFFTEKLVMQQTHAYFYAMHNFQAKILSE